MTSGAIYGLEKRLLERFVTEEEELTRFAGLT